MDHNFKKHLWFIFVVLEIQVSFTKALMCCPKVEVISDEPHSHILGTFMSKQVYNGRPIYKSNHEFGNIQIMFQLDVSLHSKNFKVIVVKELEFSRLYPKGLLKVIGLLKWKAIYWHYLTMIQTFKNV